MRDITLEERCSELDFSVQVLGNTYCSLSVSRGKNIECDFLSFEKDINGLYPCKNPCYQSHYILDRALLN